MPTWGKERGSEEGITKGKRKWWPWMQISGFSLLAHFWQFGFSSPPLHKFYKCEVFRVCWIVFSSSPYSHLFSTFLQAALCRGNQLQQIIWTRFLCPLFADGYGHWEEAGDLEVGEDQCPATWQWLCFSKTTGSVGNLPQSYGPHLSVTSFFCCPSRLRAVRAQGCLSSLPCWLASTLPQNMWLVSFLNSLQLPHLGTTYIQAKKKIKWKQESANFYPEEIKKNSGSFNTAKRTCYPVLGDGTLLLGHPSPILQDHHVSQDKSEIWILCEIPGFKILA